MILQNIPFDKKSHWTRFGDSEHELIKLRICPQELKMTLTAAYNFARDRRVVKIKRILVVVRS